MPRVRRLNPNLTTANDTSCQPKYDEIQVEKTMNSKLWPQDEFKSKIMNTERIADQIIITEVDKMFN